MIDNTPASIALSSLPEFEPAADLWSRIERRHGRRRRQRRLVAAGGVTAVLVAALAVFTLQGSPNESVLLARQQSESLRLEQDWQALGSMTTDSGYARLRPYDVGLQQAFDRRADSPELNRLWSERNQVLRDLIRNHGNGPVAVLDPNALISI